MPVIDVTDCFMPTVSERARETSNLIIPFTLFTGSLENLLC